MKITDGANEIRSRQMRASFVDSCGISVQKPEVLSLQEQAILDRCHFLTVATMSLLRTKAYEQPLPVRVSPDDVSLMLNHVVSDLSSQFQWLEQADVQYIADLLSDVQLFRRQFIEEHGAAPTDGRVYRNYRSALETAPPDDRRAHLNVVTLEALMNGDIIHGTLPAFPVQ